MSSHKEKITRLYVGELPLIKNVVERLGLKEIFAKYIKSHKNEKIPAVDSLMMLLFNITCGRQPLYELEEWVEHINPRIFGHHSFKKGVINDDRFGKGLDKLYMADRATMMTQIVISMVKLTNLDLSRIHNDSTTVKAYGKIPGRTRNGLKLERGHSKNYRPDLKQIVYNLTISSDGAVPVHYKTYEGSRTDDTTHIETWNTLCQIAGKTSFLYVADSKVCTRKQLSHIVGYGGRVVSIVPETWQEVEAFKKELRKKKKRRIIIHRRVIPENSDQIEYFSCYQGDHRTVKDRYKIHWIFSSEKKKRDRKDREKALKKTEYDLAELSGKLNARKLKTRKDILKMVDSILDERGVKEYFHVALTEITEEYKKQIGIGRPSRKTKYRTISKEIYSLSYTRNLRTLKEEKNVDGIFPLLSTDPDMTAKEALLAYKYQPRLEKRFTQFKSIHKAAPLLFKKIERVEGIMFLFFVALMLQALIEREVRHKMKDNKILALPIYPEQRIAYHPTTAKIFDRFSGISLYYLKQGRNIKRYQEELSDLQKEIISILGMSEKEYWL
jgi:transposase